MDTIRLGRLFRALRQRERLRQVDVARRVGCSQSAISRLELGEAAALSLGMIDAVARALDARLQTGLLWRGALADRLLDAQHASIVETIIRRLERRGWSATPEVTFNIFGERGSVDVLAFHRAAGTLLVVEVKTVVPDIQAMLSSLDRKARLGVRTARERGWDAASVSRLLVITEDRTARRRVGAAEATFRRALPDRLTAVRSFVRSPDRVQTLAGLLFLTDAHQASARHRDSRPRPSSSDRSAAARA